MAAQGRTSPRQPPGSRATLRRWRTSGRALLATMTALMVLTVAAVVEGTGSRVAGWSALLMGSALVLLGVIGWLHRSFVTRGDDDPVQHETLPTVGGGAAVGLLLAPLLWTGLAGALQLGAVVVVVLVAVRAAAAARTLRRRRTPSPSTPPG